MNKDIEEVNKIVDIVMEDEDVQKELYYRILDKNLEMLKQQRAYEDGEKIGEDKSKKEIAKKLLKEKVDIEIIVITTGLSKEEIEKLV